VAQELTDGDVIRAHARDELGIDIDDLANPLQVYEGVGHFVTAPTWICASGALECVRTI
jgi:hypothetical protein